jgi:predicted ester cyclase
MSQNIDNTLAYFAAVDGHRAEDTRELFAPGFTFTTPFGVITDLDELVQFSTGWYTAFPNMRHANDHVWEVGDTVICEGTFSGTQTGPMGMPDGSELPATGATVSLPYVVVVDCENGRARAVRAYLDNASMLAQLGLLPAPAQS